MKVIRIIQILLLLVLVCSCSKEQTVLSGYRDLKKELKINSSDYSMEDWERVLKECEMLEEKARQCNFSPEEKKELNKLRGQCSAYFIKSLPKQAKFQMEDAIEQISDIADGFMEAIGEEGIGGLLETEDR